MQKAITFYYRVKNETNTLLEVNLNQYCKDNNFLWCRQKVNTAFLEKFVGDTPAMLCLIKKSGNYTPVFTHGSTCLTEMQDEIENEEQ